MNAKSLIFIVLIGTISAFSSAIGIFFALPEKSNTDIEVYMLGGIMIIAAITAAIIVYLAAANKFFYAAAAFFSVCVGTIVLFILGGVLLLAICKIFDCKIFPF